MYYTDKNAANMDAASTGKAVAFSCITYSIITLSVVSCTGKSEVLQVIVPMSAFAMGCAGAGALLIVDFS